MVAPTPSPPPPPARSTEPPPPPPALGAIHDWFGDEGYVSVHRPDGSWMMRVRYDSDADEAVGVRAFEGELRFGERPPRAGGHLVVRRGEGLLLYPTDDAAPVPIPGAEAWFFAGGDRLVTAEAGALVVVDPTGGAVQRRIPVKRDPRGGEVSTRPMSSISPGGSASRSPSR